MKVDGYAIQDERGAYLCEVRMWKKDGLHEEAAWVHTYDQVKEILETCGEWEGKPTRIQKAFFDSMKTILVGTPIDIRDMSLEEALELIPEV